MASPAFDITPNATRAYPDGPPLAMATGVDGQSGTSLQRMPSAAERLQLDPNAQRAWLASSARMVAECWEPMLRQAAAPIMEDAARADQLIASVQPSFAYAEQLARAL